MDPDCTEYVVYVLTIFTWAESDMSFTDRRKLPYLNSAMKFELMTYMHAYSAQHQSRTVEADVEKDRKTLDWRHQTVDRYIRRRLSNVRETERCTNSPCPRRWLEKEKQSNSVNRRGDTLYSKLNGGYDSVDYYASANMWQTLEISC